MLPFPPARGRPPVQPKQEKMTLGTNNSTRIVATPLLVLALALGAASAAGAGTSPDPRSASSDASASGEPLEFTDIYGSPLEIEEPRPDETFTEEVREFHRTGENPYVGNEEAIEEGRELFNATCRGCHGLEASGGMGPALTDETFRHERVATDKGFFEVVHGGASGAMRAFGDRLDQADILKIMAYVVSLRQED